MSRDSGEGESAHAPAENDAPLVRASTDNATVTSYARRQWRSLILAAERVPRSVGLHTWREVWLALALAGVCALGAGPFLHWWSGPGRYRIYLVGTRADASTAETFDAFKRSLASFAGPFDGIDIQVEERDDSGRPNEAQQIAKELAAAPDTLLVLGNCLSQQTRVALQEYMTVTPPIPVITTTETADDLAAVCQRVGNTTCPLLQMCPTNLDQAKAASELAIRLNKNQVTLIRENNVTNRSYENSLDTDFNEVLRSRVVGDAYLHLDGGAANPELPRLVTSWRPDCVVYIGSLTGAIELSGTLRELLHTSPEPLFILADGAVDRDLLKNDPMEHLDGSYFLHPVAPDEFVGNPGVFGQGAACMAQALILKAAKESPTPMGRMREWLGMHRVSDARRALIKAMLSASLENTQYSCNREPCTFSGARRGPGECKFHVWHLEGQVFSDIDTWHQKRAPVGATARSIISLSGASQGVH